MKYIILAQYVKSGKNTWWTSSDKTLWRIGKTEFIPGTTTEVKIVDYIEITEEQFEFYNIL